MATIFEKQYGMSGAFHCVHRGVDGQVKDEWIIENLNVNSGLAFMAGALSGDEAAPDDMKYIAVGEGVVAADPTDTALGSEVETRATGVQSRITTTVADDTYQSVGTITFTGARAVTEYALFNQLALGGTMLCRAVSAVKNMATDETLTITYKEIFTDV